MVSQGESTDSVPFEGRRSRVRGVVSHVHSVPSEVATLHLLASVPTDEAVLAVFVERDEALPAVFLEGLPHRRSALA